MLVQSLSEMKIMETKVIAKIFIIKMLQNPSAAYLKKQTCMYWLRTAYVC